jgi:hypothetical protein
LARLNRSHRKVRRIEQIHAVISGDLLDRLAATNRRRGASLVLNSGLWVRRLLIGGSPFQERCPA